MNEIKVTTELCAEDRARLDKLLEALCSIPNAISTAGTPYPVTCETVDHKDFVEIVGTPEKNETVTTKQTPAETTPAPVEENDTDQAPVEEVAEPQHTKAELQQKIATLVSKGKKAEVKEVVQKYAPRVSDIPDDKVDEVWVLLSKLEG